MHRYSRYRWLKVNAISNDEVDAIRVLKFADLICGSLKPWRGKREDRLAGMLTKEDGGPLARIQNQAGETSWPLTGKQRQLGKKVGNSIVLNCFICRRYLDKSHQTIYHKTSFWCALCSMPLCRMDRSADEIFGSNGTDGREYSCVVIHNQAPQGSPFACGEFHQPKTAVPKGHQVSLHPRRSTRK